MEAAAIGTGGAAGGAAGAAAGGFVGLVTVNPIIVAGAATAGGAVGTFVGSASGLGLCLLYKAGSAFVGKSPTSPNLMVKEGGGVVKNTNPDTMKKWLCNGKKMVWISTNKNQCIRPYIFKPSGYVTTPFLVGDYAYTCQENAGTFKITGWTNEWVYHLQDIQYEGNTI